MARPEVPQVIEVTTTEAEVALTGASEVVVRARSSNVSQIAANISLTGEDDPDVDGAYADHAFMLFPGEEVRFPTVYTQTLYLKHVLFGSEEAAFLELIKIS